MALPELNTARFSIEIPSTGETVTYRPYLVKEEKILMMAMETEDNKVIMKATIDVIKSCLIDSDINVSSLPMFDIETLFLALRSKSVGESINLKVKCNADNCEEMNDVKLNFDDIEIPVVDNDILNVELTDDVGVIMKYPAVSEIIRVQDEDDGNIDTAWAMIMECIDAIYDADDVYPADKESKQSLTKFIDSLSSVQFMKLTAFFENQPALRHTLNYTCKCGKEQEQTLKGLASFFI